MSKLPRRIYLKVKLGIPPADQDMGVLVPVAIIEKGKEYPTEILKVDEVRGAIRCSVRVGEYEYYLFGRTGRWWMVA